MIFSVNTQDFRGKKDEKKVTDLHDERHRLVHVYPQLFSIPFQFQPARNRYEESIVIEENDDFKILT
jgi:hypothetical protein